MPVIDIDSLPRGDMDGVQMPDTGLLRASAEGLGCPGQRGNRCHELPDVLAAGGCRVSGLSPPLVMARSPGALVKFDLLVGRMLG